MLLALRDSKQAAEAASLAKSRFLSNMSHELRTPLNGVLGFTRVLLSDYDRISAREANHLLQFIYDSGLHLLSLIDDVLDLSRVETGNLEINRRLCDLHAMIHTIDLPLRQLCDTNQVELLKTVADDVQCICADETRLRQVLYNLLSNAIKYAGTGGRVELEVRGRGDHAVLVVRDDGPGIPDERKEQIFEPFERLDEHQHIQGTGLGLSIARRIVELHEGTMRVENAPDGGAVFTVELPGLVDRSAEECVKKRQEMHMAEAPRRAGENVLVVEDDYSSLMLMKYVLERNGIMADYATDCRKARQYLNVNRYGMALLDVNLPDGSGVELLQEIRQQMPECVVYALTAHAMQRDRERLLKAGFDAYLAKPIDLDDLVERIRTGG
jgi:CheY-like chemotaxis protein